MVRTIRQGISTDSAELTVEGCCFCHLQPTLRAFRVPSGAITHPMETWDSSTERFCALGLGAHRHHRLRWLAL